MMGFQITSFEPDLFTFLEVDGDKAFLRHTEGSFGLITCFSNLSESGRDIRGLRLFIG
jgi:hypothetical protein